MTTAPSADQNAVDGRFLAAVVIAATVLRLYRIGAQSVWVDEMLTLSVSLPKPGLNIWDYLKYNIHGPLHAFVVYIFSFVSKSDAWLRLPSALAGVGAVVYFYLWVRSWLGERVAKTATVILMVHPLHVYYSQELRNYSFLFLFAMMACYRFERLTGKGKRRDWLGYVAAITAAALSNFTAAFLFLVHTILYVARRGIHWKPLLRWAVVGLVVLVLISPWIYRIYTFVDVSKLVTPVAPGQITESERLRGSTTFNPVAIPYMLYTFSAGFSLGPSTRELHEDHTLGAVLGRHGVAVGWVAVVFGVVSILGVWNAIRGRRRWGEILLYLLVPVVCVFALNWQNAKAFNVRYVLLSLPPFLCLLAVGITALGGWLRGVALAAVLSTLLVSTGNYYFNGRYARDDVRSAVRRIERGIAEGDCILAPTVHEIVTRYYHGPAPVYGVFQREWLAKEKVDAQLAPAFAACNSLWYLRARPWVDDADGYLLTRLGSRYGTPEVTKFNGVTLLHYPPKKEAN